MFEFLRIFLHVFLLYDDGTGLSPSEVIKIHGFVSLSKLFANISKSLILTRLPVLINITSFAFFIKDIISLILVFLQFVFLNTYCLNNL